MRVLMESLIRTFGRIPQRTKLQKSSRARRILSGSASLLSSTPKKKLEDIYSAYDADNLRVGFVPIKKSGEAPQVHRNWSLN